MTTAPRPTFRELDASEAAELLARNHVGRIAYSFHNRIDIEPISYVYADGVIYMRTQPGSKLATLAHAPWVAFEVDEIRGPFDWRSVVARGTVYVLGNTGSKLAHASYQLALQHLRALMPHAFDEQDPTPDRTVVLQIHPDVVIGREARAAGSEQRRPRTFRRGLPDRPCVRPSR